MDASTYRSELGELYAAEVLGEALANRWLELSSDPDEKYKLGLFLQLESEAKVRLRPMLARHGISLIEEARHKSAGVTAAEQLAALPWKEAMATLARLALPYVHRFEALEKVTKQEDLPLVRFMVDHERSVTHIAEREAVGEPAMADELVVKLAHPLARTR
jgi:hypothetical protein